MTLATIHMLSLGVAAVSVLGFLAKALHSESKFHLLAINSSDVVAIHDREGRFLWVSPSVFRMLGKTPEALVGHLPYQLFHPEDLKPLQVCLKTLHSEAVRTTYRVRGTSGQYLWVETIMQPRKDLWGRLVGFQTSTRDVTEQRDAQDLYRFLVRHLPKTSVFLFDAQFKHRIAGGDFLDLVDECLTGKTLDEVYPPEVSGVLSPYYSRIFEGHPSKIEYAFGHRTYRIHFLPIYGAQGVVEMGMAVFHDVTQEKAHTKALLGQTQDLERSNRDLEQFANVASHELKSPLRRIQSFVDLLSDDYFDSLTEEADEYLQHIREGVENLQAVVESLLVYSRVQVQDARNNMTWVDLNQVCEEAIQSLSLLIEEKGAKIKVSGLPGMVAGDAGLLRQVFENLIGNAIKFTPEGVVPEIQVWVDRNTVNWEIAVKDNGFGIDPNQQDKIFKMFHRLNHHVEGTGIGLALCKKIVETHRGEIWVHSAIGEGSTFRFSIPDHAPSDVI